MLSTRTKRLLLWATVAFATFFVLDVFAISTGDDLGYMFADSKLHKADGVRITTLMQCFTTQCQHYQSTNGRFLVHVLTSALLSVTSRWVFLMLNSVMFALLMALVAIHARIRSHFGLMSALTSLWVLLPCSGVVLLSLVAFSTNYLFSAVAFLALLWLFSNTRKSLSTPWLALVGVLSVIVGSLHESYTIPLTGALAMYLLVHRRNASPLQWVIFIGVAVGCIIEVVAPGNFSHLQQGGGFELESLRHKFSALIDALVTTPIVLLPLTLLQKKQSLRAFLQDNLIFYVAIVISLLLASISFTSVRQLYCPCIYSIIILLRWAKSLSVLSCAPFRRAMSLAVSLTLVGVLAIALSLRNNTYVRYSEALAEVQRLSLTGGTIATVDASDCNYNQAGTSWWRRFAIYQYDDDPISGDYLKIFADSYTKQGLSRLYWDDAKGNHIKVFLPYPFATIRAKLQSIDESSIKVINDSVFVTPSVRLDHRYCATRLRTELVRSKSLQAFPSADLKSKLSSESYIQQGYTYLVYQSQDEHNAIYIKAKTTNVKKK